MNLNEFKKISDEDWKIAIKNQLKGKLSFEDLVYKDITNIEIPPFITQETLSKLNIKPYKIALPNTWVISQKINLETPILAKSLLKSGIKNPPQGFLLNYSKINSLNLLKEVNLKNTPLTFLAQDAKAVTNYIIKNNYTKNSTIVFNPLKNLCEKGNWFKSKQEDLNSLSELLKSSKVTKRLEVSSIPFAESGAHAIEELTYCFSTIIYYFEELLKLNTPIETIAKNTCIEVSIGNPFLLEISKIKATRWIWMLLLEAYQLNHNDYPLYIRTVTKTTHYSLTSPRLNILRACSGNMAAVIGGTNEHINIPFDEPLGKQTLESFEIAQNIQHLLEYESLFSKVANPLDGSFTIEYLTHKLAEKIWKNIQENEHNSSIETKLISGEVQKSIARTRKKTLDLFKKKKAVIIGVNKYKNTEKKESELWKEVNFQAEQTLISPLKRINYPALLS